MSPPRARRPSIFNAEVIPDPRLLAQQQQQSPTSPTATQPVAVSGSPTQARGESAASFPIQLSSSAASSVNSTSLLDHRGYPSPNYGPPTRRLSTMQGSSGTGAGSGQSASSSSATAAAAAAAAAALSGTDDEDDSVTVGSESMPLLVGHEPAATLDKRNKQRMRRTGSIAREHELFMQRRANSDTAAVPAAGSTSAGHQQQQQGSAENDYHLDMNELANSYNDVSSEVGSVGRADHDGLDDFSRNMSTASLGDVCVPLESEVYDPDSNKQRCWPDVSALEEWVTTENAAANSGPELVMVDGRPRYREGPSYYLEDNTAQFKGRRPPGQQREPSRNPAERLGYPFRFTYFREDVEKTIHSQDISGLLGHGMSFSELFPVSNDVVPSTLATAMPSPVNEEVPIVVADEKGETLKPENTMPASMPEPQPPQSTLKGGMGGKFDSVRSIKSRAGSSYFPSAGAISSLQAAAGAAAAASSSRATSVAENRPYPFFLDILDPTDQEMKVISKAFGIHPLTTEDICMEETREKVELFRTYYLVCFRSFAIQPHMSARERRTRQGSEAARRRSNFGRKGDLVPVNMYLVVFRDGVLSFHFQPTPHPANVRRRIRQLRDYVSVSADWISYAIIDNVTDAFAPLISEIEDEVQAIDTEILEMHSGELSDEDGYDSDEYGDGDGEGGEGVDDYRSELNRKQRMRRRGGQEGSETSSIFSSRSTRTKYDVKNRGDMLRRIGECRKQVMSIMRLLGFKADVIKGFAKRCNEQWEVAPRSEIGLYLGDIQDHIITMVQNLTHYEKLLARSHSNYLAQINIEMTAVNNETNDVLGRLTILGTIVLPMNIITGLWGMNVLVPGQEAEGLSWFYSITLGLIIFGLGCYFAAKKVYGIAV